MRALFADLLSLCLLLSLHIVITVYCLVFPFDPTPYCTHIHASPSVFSLLLAGLVRINCATPFLGFIPTLPHALPFSLP